MTIKVSKSSYYSSGHNDNCLFNNSMLVLIALDTNGILRIATRCFENFIFLTQV